MADHRLHPIIRAAVMVACLLASSTTVAQANTLPPGPPLVIGTANYHHGTVPVSVEASTGLSAVRFEDGVGAVLGQVLNPTGPTAALDVALRANMTVAAIGLDAVGTPVWRSTTQLVLANYVPRAPSLALVDNGLVGSRLSATGRLNGSTATTMTLFVRGNPVWSGPAPLTGNAFALPAVSLRYGVSAVQVRATNGFGAATSARVRAYNLGKTLNRSRFILVDKSDLLLYYVLGSRVVRVWPVAIGTPATPTRTGTFRLGRWVHTPSSVWGPRRMPLLKKVRKRYRRTSYYIHGTNNPSSIGTMASHGCVRMYNRDAIKLSRISRGFMVQIRK